MGAPDQIPDRFYAWLAQLGERRSAERKVTGSTPAGPTLRVFK